MPESRKTSLKAAKYDQNIAKKKPSSASKKDKQPYTVGPVMLAVFLFVVVGSAIIQILSSSQKGLPG